MDPEEVGLEEAIGAALDEQLEPVERQEAPVEQKEVKQENPFPKAADLKEKEDAPKEYVREGRRFVLKNGKETEVKEGEATKDAEPAAKEWKPLWYKDDYGDWAKLPDAFRKALQDQERNASKAIEERATAAKAWEPINELVKPFEAQLRAQGQTPQQFVGGLVNIYGYLQQDPVQALNWLAQQTLGPGWDIQALAEWQAQNGVQANKVDPVKEELETLKQKLAALEQAPQRQYQESVERTVSEWSKDKPYWQELQSTVYGLIQADPSARERFRADPKGTLDSLYDQAQWAHPTIRDRILEDKRKADVQRARANGFGTREQTHTQGQLKQTPRMSVEEEIGNLIDGMI